MAARRPAESMISASSHKRVRKRVRPRILVFRGILRDAFQLGHGATTLALVGRLQLAGAATRLAGVPQRQPLTDPA